MVLLLSFVIVIAGIQFVKSQNETNDLYAHLHNSSDFTTSIINGQKVSLGNYPWFASVDIWLHNGIPYHICGGTLIDESWVLTAAHCFLGNDYEYNVKIGKLSEHSSEGITSREVDYLCIHEEYSAQTSAKDIALLRLKEPVDGAETLQLATHGSMTYYENMPLRVIGMGLEDQTNKIYSDHLMEADVFLIKSQDCKKAMNVFFDNSKICASGHGIQDVCAGDSGGPLLRWTGHGWEQEGVISSGHQFCNTGFPTLYTKTRSMKSWIERVLNNDYDQCLFQPQTDSPTSPPTGKIITDPYKFEPQIDSPTSLPTDSPTSLPTGKIITDPYRYWQNIFDRHYFPPSGDKEKEEHNR